jgi:hypothetical protein
MALEASRDHTKLDPFHRQESRRAARSFLPRRLAGFL